MLSLSGLLLWVSNLELTLSPLSFVVLPKICPVSQNLSRKWDFNNDYIRFCFTYKVWTFHFLSPGHFPRNLFATRITGNPEMESPSAVKLQHHFGIFFVIVHGFIDMTVMFWLNESLASSPSVLEGRCSLPRLRSLSSASPFHLLKKLNGTQISLPSLMPPNGRQISQARF